jgi:pimeloyl-ACP methyl ester carboxylesterase
MHGAESAEPALFPPEPVDHLVWHSTIVGGLRANYGTAGEGLPLLFLHGWGLGHHSYKRALKRLVHLGCQVFAPAMPGFGGTADLRGGEMNLAGYAKWVRGFLEAVGVDEPVLAVGHSFGGAVAVQLAHDFPDMVSYLVLVNAVGGSAWRAAGSKVRSMSERPLLDWGLHAPNDFMQLRTALTMLRVMLEDAVPNFLCNPLALYRAGQLARKADLTPELEALRERRLPVVVLWGDRDTLVPRASFEALCAALGSTGEVVHGRHSWLLADPDAFGEVMANSVTVAQTAREMQSEWAVSAARSRPGRRRKGPPALRRSLASHRGSREGAPGAAITPINTPKRMGQLVGRLGRRQPRAGNTEVAPPAGDARRVQVEQER